MSERTGTETPTSPGMRASRLLRVRTLWVTVIAITSVLIVLMTVIYVGSVVDPVDHLHGLPVLVVNEDAGGAVGARHVDIGAQVVAALEHSSAVSSRLSLDSVTMTEARERMDSNGAYATIVIPRNLTASTLALYGVKVTGGPTAALPTIRLLANVRAGSLGVSLATEVADPALAVVSRVVGQTVTPLTPATSPSEAALQANPLTVVSVSYRPLPPHSALGLSAFYISLLAIMCGFLGGTLINATVDGALGYATNEIGPKWQQRMPVRITRWQTLLAKWAMALVVPPILTALLLLVSIGLLGMDASHIVLLWVFLAFGAVVIAMGTLVLFAALGNLGQLVAMLVFVYLALASSGGTIPLEALPGILRFAANFEPLRQILDGTRSILYFNASGAAGLTRGFVLTGVGIMVWLVLGLAVTRWYDYRGLDRMQPEVLDYVSRSAATYAAGLREPPGVGSDGLTAPSNRADTPPSEP
jgi:YhgE/Pip-like protein